MPEAKLLTNQTDELNMVEDGNMAVGFKQREVGVIPEDWEVANLGDFSDIKTGPFGSSLHQKDYVVDGTPIITVEHLGELGISHRNIPMVSETDRKRLISYSMHTDDIVFSRVGSVDRNSIVTEKESGWLFSGRLLRIRTISKNISPKYLSFYFHQERFKQRVRSVAVGQTMPSLNTQILKGIQVALPPTRTEQNAIATTLSDMDALIESLGKLLTKKRLIKQGAMQELLRPKEGWEVKALGEMGDIDNDNLSSSTALNFTFNYISLEDIEHGVLTNSTETKFADAPSRARRRLNPGDVLLATVRPNLKSHLLFDLKSGIYVCSTGFSVIRCKSNVLNCDYLFHHLFAKYINEQIESVIAGSNYPAISSKDVKALLIPLPPNYDEQARIARILSDMDGEIEQIEAQLSKCRQVKTGMMQDLLTGKKRLITTT